ncbi:CTD phosphatase Fcp1 [Schizosaccharomyces japonicus yFS275]|uniref:RNA polymerase II subunit A C-terminal domain phosphatase n=1 Tax=Schizosaccharomyces japonicus (strain yFS275 / FY16936) TaxID=402676 RepID=B6K094_SCHJY|nr:CTD phosphatase Fcp1 [Schizosaccharomyces japonicus yFS275]EEB06244.2 CTD phosphatase Fcp1 [Schizosaccharomyces japonicus yFS275]
MTNGDTSIKFPGSLNYPVEISSRLVKTGDYVKKHEPLLLYRFYGKVEEDQEDGTTQLVDRVFVEQFESPVEGELTRWIVEEGDQVNNATEPILCIKEPCSHEVHYGGLCAICGQNITNQDYMGFSDLSRATINMTHGSGGLTEARRLETETAIRLQKQKRLSLIVDLDQTIIHATVDPTVGEWMKDPNNVNYKVLRDVHYFYLREGTSGYTSCYYIKPRPGLQEFLHNVSKLYELHIYTMGTKAYATEVAKVIDPDGELFQDRVLSRDDSGNLTQKSIRRLFPCDTSMVVVIDDRGDVWNWSSNLIKVYPFEFFVGIGDINSNFLSKTIPLPRGEPEPTEKETRDENESTPDAVQEATPTVGDRTLLEENFMQSPNTLKEQSDEHMTALDKTPYSVKKALNLADILCCATMIASYFISKKVLTNIHHAYYDRLEEFQKSSSTIAQEPTADVGLIIPEMKKRVLSHCRILFSGIIPLGVDVITSDIAKWAMSFGAHVLLDLKDNPTHLVASKVQTEKVRRALEIQTVKVVNLDWLLHSMSQWKALPEENFLLYPNQILKQEAVSGPSGNDGSEISSVISESDEGEDRVTEINDRELDDIDWNEADKDVEGALGDITTDFSGDESDRSDLQNGEDEKLTPAAHMAKRRREALSRKSSLTRVLSETDSPTAKRTRHPSEGENSNSSSRAPSEGETDIDDLADLDSFANDLEADLEGQLEPEQTVA